MVWIRCPPARFRGDRNHFIGHFEWAGEAIEIPKALGGRIALDVFGTGYSSLRYIHRPCRTIVRTIVRSLGVQCVVEGAETAAQVGILRELGCETMPGERWLSC